MASFDDLDSLFFGVPEEPAVKEEKPDPFGPWLSYWHEGEQRWMDPREWEFRARTEMLDRSRKERGLRPIPKKWRERELTDHLRILGIECKIMDGKQP